MNHSHSWYQSAFTNLHLTPVRITAAILVIAGLVLGTAVHKGFLIMMTAGAFGPSVLRQFNLLDDLDEFQKEAAAQAGLRSYLTGALFMMLIMITGGWQHLAFSDDLVPASVMVTIMLVVYYSSYCLSFWDARKAVSLILMTFGLFWLAFSILSTGGDLIELLKHGLWVPAPFILCAILCRRWPRTVGLVLFIASIAATLQFNLLPLDKMESQKVFSKLFVFALIPLPLIVGSIALLTVQREDTSE